MANTEKLVSEPEVELSHDIDKNLEHSEACSSFTRSDSGKGKSLTSQDLGDEDNNLDNGCAEGTCTTDSPKENNIALDCPVKKTKHQDAFDSHQDPSKLLSQIPTLNPLSIEFIGPISQPGFKSSVIGSPERSVESTEDSYGKSLQDSNNDTASTARALTYDPQHSPLPRNAQLELFDTSNASSPGNIQKCQSVPAASSPTTGHFCGFSSLPLLYTGLVSKDIMDQLVKELVREKSRVEALQQFKHQLLTSVSMLETRHQEDAELIHKADFKVNQLQERNEHIPFLQEQSAIWRQKHCQKEQELIKQRQEIETLRKRCGELEQKVLGEEKDKVAVTNSLEALRLVLRNERVRFSRDEKAFKKKIEQLEKVNKELEEVNQWLREGQEITPYQTVADESTDEDLPLRCAQQLGPDSWNGSSETQLKGVFPENAAENNYSVHNMQGARPKEVSTKSNGVRNNEDNVEDKCLNCYRMRKYFASYEEFKEHKDKCEL